jgi:hypothetical protein
VVSRGEVTLYMIEWLAALFSALFAAEVQNWI